MPSLALGCFSVSGDPLGGLVVLLAADEVAVHAANSELARAIAFAGAILAAVSLAAWGRGLVVRVIGPVLDPVLIGHLLAVDAGREVLLALLDISIGIPHAKGEGQPSEKSKSNEVNHLQSFRCGVQKTITQKS